MQLGSHVDEVEVTMTFIRFQYPKVLIRWDRKSTPWQLNVLDLFILCFVVLYTTVVMSKYNLRIATLPQDDGPIFYADVYKYPNNYTGVYQYNYPTQEIIKLKVFTSAPNFLAAMLWRFIGIDPYWTTFIILIVQTAGLGIAVYYFVRSIVQNKIIAVMATVFSYPAQIQNFTPANYGPIPYDVVFPYSAYLSIPPVLLGFVLMVRGKYWRSLAMLFLAGLIHPNLAIYAAGIMGLYWIWEDVLNKDFVQGIRHAIGIIVVGLLFMAPTMYLYMSQSYSYSATSDIQFIAGIKSNQHLWPWKPFWSYFSLQAFLAWLCLAIISWRYRMDFNPLYQRLWMVCLIAGLFFSILQILGGILESPLLLNLGGLRSTTWLSLVSLPLIINYWYECLRSRHFLFITLALLYYFLPLGAKASYNYSWLLILAFAMMEVSQVAVSFSKKILARFMPRLLTCSASLSVALMMVSYLKLLPDNSQRSLQGLSLITWTGDTIWDLPERILAISAIVVIAVLIVKLNLASFGSAKIQSVNLINKLSFETTIQFVVVLFSVYYLTLQMSSPNYKVGSDADYVMQAQRWANEHTPPSSLFVTDLPWMNFSRRGRFYPFTREADQYLSSQNAEQFRLRLLRFYGITDEKAELYRGNAILQEEIAKYADFQENDFLRFANEFGASHLVVLTTRGTLLTLPVVYQNEYVRIYSLGR